MTFPKTLKKLRIERGWTQSKLAKKIGVPKQTISALENNYYCPSKKVLKNLAEAFGVQVEQLGKIKNHRNKYNYLKKKKREGRKIQIEALELKEKKCLNQRCLLNCNCLCQSVIVTNNVAGCKSENLITEKDEDKKFFIDFYKRIPGNKVSSL